MAEGVKTNPKDLTELRRTLDRIKDNLPKKELLPNELPSQCTATEIINAINAIISVLK